MSSANRLRKRLRHQVLICGIIGFLLPLLRTIILGPPEPYIQDEFSYLLAAETFAEGRLTNPSPPLPEFFETIHVLVEPTYQSKYQPGGPLLMALGWRCLGDPLWGVWLQSGLFGSALCWMMQTFRLRRWAAPVTLFALCALAPRTSLGHGYLPALLTAASAAAFVGGLNQTFRRPRMGTTVLLALGVAGLGLTRPYEGGLVALGCVPRFLFWLGFNRRTSLSRKLITVLLPGMAIVAAAAFAIGVYNQAVTGSWKTMPYGVVHAQYFREGLWIFQPELTPTRAPPPRIADIYSQFHEYTTRMIKVSPLARIWERLCWSWNVALCMPQMSMALWFAGPWIVWGIFSRRLRPYLPSFLAWLTGTYLATWHSPWYAAPIWPLFYAALVEPFNQIRPIRSMCRLFPPVDRPLLLVTLAGALALCGWTLARWDAVRHPSGSDGAKSLFLDAVEQGLLQPASARPRSLPELRRWFQPLSGRHLIFVRYDADYSNTDEWVYNRADIPGSHLMLAHDLGDERNQELIALFPDRRIWKLHISKADNTLSIAAP